MGSSKAFGFRLEPRRVGAFGAPAAGSGKNIRIRATALAALFTPTLVPILLPDAVDLAGQGLRIIGGELGLSEGARPVPPKSLASRVEPDLKPDSGPFG